ncbi:hypothetical protein [Phocaeicola barnesiae]|uniref:hypothetical protein n=1 Tax=Phocaeicola barnesiae TaxID=376804 RepID=UPI00038130A9|nr:hypothetical protein [Phocaeicola barnesiae]
MGMNKFFMLGLAGLAFAACNNEEVIDTAHQNGATVTVRFVGDAITRTLETPATGDNGQTFPVEVNSGKITLTAQAVDVPSHQISGSLDGSSEYTFTGVRAPESIEVVVNEGTEDNMSLADVYNTGLAEPLYGKSSTFVQDSEGNYTVTINLERRLARLQFSGLNFTTVGSSYTALTLDGIYLNGAVKTENGSDKATADNIGAWETVTTTWSTNAPVYDEIGAVIIGADAETGPWPSAAQCYAYNIFPASGTDNLPKLTVCFSNAVQTNVTGSEYRYARVAKYKLEGEKGNLEGIDDNGYITDFKAGYIYNITGLILGDGDLGPTPDGEGVTLTATVTVDPWTLVNATVEWK